MVGRCPEVEVLIRGERVPCVLDTGSQVTLFSQSLFKRCFGEAVMLGAEDLSWLTLRAANGLQIPYIGYAVLDFTIGGIEVPGRGIVIVKDDCMSTDYGLLGMNVMSECWETLFKQGHPRQAAFKSLFSPAARKAWEKAFTICQRIQVTPTQDMAQGVAKLERQAPILVPPESEMIVWAYVPQALGGEDCPVLVEDLPDGQGMEERSWRVARTLSWARGGKVPVRICNPNLSSVHLPQKQALAVVSRIDPLEVHGSKELVIKDTEPGVLEVDVRP